MTDKPTGQCLCGRVAFYLEKPTIYALQGDHPRLTGEEVLATLNLSSDEAK